MEFRCVNRKEFMAILRLIIACLCFWNYQIMGFYAWYTFDVNIYEHRVLLIALATYNIYGALGTWLWRSNNAWSRMYGRIVTIFVNGIVMVLLLYTHNKYMQRYNFIVYDYFDPKDLFEGEEKIMIKNLELLHITLMFVGAICFVEAYMVYAHIINTLKRRGTDNNTNNNTDKKSKALTK